MPPSRLPIHLFYYLAGVCGWRRYRFLWLDGRPWSPGLHRDLLTGRLEEPPPGVRRCVERLAPDEETGLLVARLHHVLSLYPPVDDPVEYLRARYPLIPVEKLQQAWRRLEAKDIRRALRVPGTPA